MDCACCGLALEVGLTLVEDSEYVCPGCGATNVLFFDDAPGRHAEPYFGSWKCKHGVSGDEPCDQCEIEHGVAV